MRRRQVFQAMHAAAERATELRHEVATPEHRLPAPGDCPKCGKHIGRGVHFHAKKCEG